MEPELIDKPDEPLDGDWCLVDLSEEICGEATKAAHALGMNFHDFMCAALEEKLAGLRGDEELRRRVGDVRWMPLLK